MKKIVLILTLINLLIFGACFYYFYNDWLKTNFFIEKDETGLEKKGGDALIGNTILPESFILDIPFITQAPFRSWKEYPFNHTCEEASVLQIHYYFERKQVKEDETYKELLDLVNYEIRNYGFHEDTSAAQTAKLIEDYYGYKTKVVYGISLEDIKEELANGNPVIVPTAGRLLGNPHFTPPGPFYHMLVIKGYNQKGFITNDVGTYKTGENWLYSYDVIKQAIHDWNNGDVLNGKSAMIIIYPPSSFFYLKDLKEFKNNLISESKDFLEANLAEMKVKIYKNGSLEKELPIFTKGNPERWGGTSVGLYKILSKNKLGYSALADSYMPWSLHIYGKYYIHGDNYYIGRGADTSPITGGCLRLKDENAKFVYDLTEIGMPVLVTDKGFENDNYKYSSEKLKESLGLSAKSYLVADLDSGFILATKNSQRQLPVASLTKLMTATIIAEIVDLRKSILVTPDMLEASGSTEGLTAGKNFRAFELFYPLLIESSNDAAEVLSRFLGKEETIKLMNEKTKAILMENTKFVDPSGISSQNISTAEDLFYLTRYIRNARPMFLNISKGEEVWTFGLQNSFKNLENKNIFFGDPNFLGGKTGYLPESKNNALFIFKFLTNDKKTRNIAIILLGSEENRTDVQKIYKWLQKNYSFSLVDNNSLLNLNIINKILPWGRDKLSNSRTIDTIIIHSSFNILGEDPYDLNGIIEEWKTYNVSAHYLIARDGAIYRLASENDITYHAGTSKMPDGRANVNNFSLGIELVNSKTDNLTEEQYTSLAGLVKFLKKEYKINYILGHNQIAPERKTDPWNFDWEKFNKMIKG